METIVKIKTRDDWELDVLGIPYGGPNNGRDADGEFFDSATKLHDDKFPLPPAVYYHGFDESGHPSGSPEYIGKTVSFTDKPDGRWYRVVLDKANELAGKVWEAAKQGIARASSGSISHLARVDSNGRILEWPVAELSLFDAVGTRQPANAYAVALPVLKARTDLEALLQEADGTPATEDATEAVELSEVVTNKKEVIKMAEKEEVKEVPTVDLSPITDALAGIGETMKAFNSRLDEIDSKVNEPTNDPGPAAKAVNVVTDTSDWKYDNHETQDLALTMNVIKSATQREADPELKRAFFRRLESAEAQKDAGLRDAARRAKSLRIKANETNFTTNVGFGDEWVGVAYSSDLWEKVRAETFVMENLARANGNRTAPPGAETITFPLEGDDPVWYTVAQAGDPSSGTAQVTNTVPAKGLGTGKVTASLAKSGTSVIYTGEMVEDSVLDFVSAFRAQLVKSGAEIMEAIAINGDTETSATTNINDIGGTPAATDWFMVANGFRKSCLITTTANSRDGGTLASDDFVLTSRLMGNAGIGALDPSKIAYIVDPYTLYKASQLTDVKTRDVFSGATIENGRLAGIYGTPVYASGQMHKGATNLLANTAGKVDLDTQGNNTTGAILAVRWDQWRFGYRRDMTIEVERIPRADAWEITSLMRFYLAQRDTEAAAISYNLTV